MTRTKEEKLREALITIEEELKELEQKQQEDSREPQKDEYIEAVAEELEMKQEREKFFNSNNDKDFLTFSKEGVAELCNKLDIEVQ